MVEKGKGKRAARLILNILMWIFLIACGAMVLVSLTSKRSEDGAVTIGGKELRLVLTKSMEKCSETDVSGYKIKEIREKSVILIERVPEEEEEAEKWYGELKKGDVLTFRYVYTKQETITHRIVEIEAKETGGYRITLEGDNKNSETGVMRQTIDTSESDSPNYIIGKVKWTNYPLGVMLYILKQPIGLSLVVIVPSGIIIVWEVIRIVRCMTDEKRQKEREEREKQQNEIEELKAKLAALEQNGNVASPENEPEEKTNPREESEGKGGG